MKIIVEINEDDMKELKDISINTIQELKEKIIKALDEHADFPGFTVEIR